jgi:hypothetical protein
MHSACSSAFLWVYNLGLCDMLASLWRRFAPGGPPEEPVSLSLADAAAATQWPVRPGLLVTRDVVPDELSVDIFRHTLRSAHGLVKCWTMVSRGLLRHKQAELAFTVKREPGELEDAYPESLIRFFGTVHQFAARSQFVSAGGVSVLAPESPGFLGRPDFRGIAYAPAEPLDGIPLGPSSLTGLILTGREMDVVRQYGLVRVMALLGNWARYFPAPPWADRKRDDIMPVAANGTLLGGMVRVNGIDSVTYLAGRQVGRTPLAPTGALANGTVMFKERRVVLELGTQGLNSLREGMSYVDSNRVLALVTGPDPLADACLVWNGLTGQPLGIERPGGRNARLLGNHVVLSAGGEGPAVRILEDGFGVVLTNELWSSLRSALDHRPVSWTIPPSDDISFSLVSLQPS